MPRPVLRQVLRLPPALRPRRVLMALPASRQLGMLKPAVPSRVPLQRLPLAVLRTPALKQALPTREPASGAKDSGLAQAGARRTKRLLRATTVTSSRAG